jgi:hypothetical protein
VDAGSGGGQSTDNSCSKSPPYTSGGEKSRMGKIPHLRYLAISTPDVANMNDKIIAVHYKHG